MMGNMLSADSIIKMKLNGRVKQLEKTYLKGDYDYEEKNYCNHAGTRSFNHRMW